MSEREGAIDVVMRIPEDRAVDDIRDPFLRAQVADALDMGTDPKKLLVLERELLKLRCPKAAAAIGRKARQIRHVEVQEQKAVKAILLGDLKTAEKTQKATGW